MAQATHLARTTAADRAMVQSTGTQYALSHAPGTQYHLVQSSQTYVNVAAALLADAVWYIDAAAPGYSGGQTVPNLGTGGSALDATLGSTGGADSNDPKHLAWTGENYCYLPGVASNYLSVPDEAALDIVGDIDIRVKVALDDWTPTVDQDLVAKWSVAAQNSYVLRLQAAGALRLFWSTDGNNFPSAISSVTVPATDGQALWVRATLDVDNGASGNTVTFYTSSDGSSWTQLGSAVTTAGTTSIFSGSNVVYVGFASSTFVSGKFYRAQILNGIDGTTVLDIDTSVLTSGAATSFTALTGQTVTINRSAAGKKATAVAGGKTFLTGTDDYIDSAATGTSQIVVSRTWSGSTPTFSINYSTSPNGRVGYGGAAPTDGEVIASAMWDRTLTAAEQAALLTYFQTRG